MAKQAITEKQRHCSICGHVPLRATTVDRTFEYGTDEEERIRVHAAQVPIEVCDSCGETYTGPEAARVEHEAICRTLGLPSPSEIVALRERLGLSQSELAELTGIGKATISRWERGRMLPNRAMARYLSLLDYRENVDRLRHTASRDGPDTNTAGGNDDPARGSHADADSRSRLQPFFRRVKREQYEVQPGQYVVFSQN